MLRKSTLALSLCAALTGAAAVQAQPETVIWENLDAGARAVGHFDINPFAADLTGQEYFHGLPDAALHLLDLTITGAGGGDGVFHEGDFTGYVFASFEQLDFSRELIGQVNFFGLAFGGSPAGHFTGDFNLIGGGGAAPTGTDYFTLTTANGAGYALRVVSISPTASAPEPAGWSLMLLGLGLTGAGLRRTRLARA